MLHLDAKTLVFNKITALEGQLEHRVMFRLGTLNSHSVHSKVSLVSLASLLSKPRYRVIRSSKISVDPIDNFLNDLHVGSLTLSDVLLCEFRRLMIEGSGGKGFIPWDIAGVTAITMVLLPNPVTESL